MMSVVFGIGEVESVMELGGEGVEYFVAGRSVAEELFVVYVNMSLPRNQTPNQNNFMLPPPTIHP
jgi:hypothetical protein